MVKKSETTKKTTTKTLVKKGVEVKNSPADIIANELVAEASIDATIEKPKKEAPKAKEFSSKVTVLNTSYNEILLNPGKAELSVRIAPKEIKTIDRDLYRELMKNQVIRNWFDKGILATKKDADEVSVHEAKVPENLKNPVERTDSVSTVSASVTKFEKDGTVNIQL
mgnify:CR=1 FL=1